MGWLSDIVDKLYTTPDGVNLRHKQPKRTSFSNLNFGAKKSDVRRSGGLISKPPKKSNVKGFSGGGGSASFAKPSKPHVGDWAKFVRDNQKSSAPTEIVNYDDSSQMESNNNLNEALSQLKDYMKNYKPSSFNATLDTSPIEKAQKTSVDALNDALQSSLAGLGKVRKRSKAGYDEGIGNVKDMYGAHIKDVEKNTAKTAQGAGNYLQKQLGKIQDDAAKTLDTGVKQDNKVNKSLRDNLGAPAGTGAGSAELLDQAKGNIVKNIAGEKTAAAKETKRDTNAGQRYGNALRSEEGANVSSMEQALAGVMSGYDMQEGDLRTNHAGSKAGLLQQFAEKLMNARQQQQKINYDSKFQLEQMDLSNRGNALDKLFGLAEQDKKSAMDSRQDQRDAQNELNQLKYKNDSRAQQDRAKYEHEANMGKMKGSNSSNSALAKAIMADKETPMKDKLAMLKQLGLA